jgi:hypothetical protein
MNRMQGRLVVERGDRGYYYRMFDWRIAGHFR